ncbi:MAG: cell division protein FtsQ/DivIB [Thermoanaerobaculia bacterium]
MSRRDRMPSLAPPETERFRRRQFVAPHRRRKLAFRLAKPFLAALAIVGLPSVLVAWVLFSNQFTVRGVTVSTGDRVSSGWAGERLSTLQGRHLLRLDVGEVEHALADHPWVAGVLVHRRLPRRLHVEILEKQPAALLLRSDALLFVDPTGREIGAYDPGADPGDLVVLSTVEDSPELVRSALGLVDDWRRLRLPWAEGLSEVLALTTTDFRVITAGLPCPLFVSSVNLAEGLNSLARYGSQIEQKMTRSSPIGAIDLRFRGRIVLQPVAETPRNLEGETNA